MERKAHHTEQVVRIEPGALAIGPGPQGEEILKMRRWMITPDTSATSMNMPARPTMYMPTSPAWRL